MGSHFRVREREPELRFAGEGHSHRRRSGVCFQRGANRSTVQVIDSNVSCYFSGYSHHDTACKPETFYHGVLLHVLFSQHGRDYRLCSNKEYGLGRADLVLEPIFPGQKPAVILELKSSSTSSLERDAAKALAQIREKRYFDTLPPGTTRAILWGIAFSGSDVFVKSTSLPVRTDISEE